MTCTFLVAAASVAHAGACGDHVDGKRVECKCGDTVVSDTVLRPFDAVAVERCHRDGLLILAPQDSDGITLNLAGLSLLGYGHGAGVHVLRGGRLGSVILGGGPQDARAEIVGFSTGIRASGSRAVREVRGIDVHGNTKDGVKVHSSGAVVADIVADSNGRHGLSIRGRDNQISDVVSDANGRDGLHVEGSRSSVSAQTSGNRRHGTVISGREHQLGDVTSTNNGSAGVVARGNEQGVDHVLAVDNGRSDVVGHAGDHR